MGARAYKMARPFQRERAHFFFKAEDGIRVVAVTGVQTCALPISPSPAARAAARSVLARSPERCEGKPGVDGSDRASALGLPVRPLAPQEKEQANTQGSLVVEEVAGPAQAAEVEPGDIILGINGRREHSVKELQDAAKSPGKSVALLIQREDAQIFVPLRLP